LLRDENDSEDDVIYGKIKQIQDSLRDPNAEPHDPLDSQVTFNENSQIEQNDNYPNYEVERYHGSRPSDVVLFDDKSDIQNVTGRSVEHIDLNEIMFPEKQEEQENQEQPDHDKSGDNFYKNEGSSDNNDDQNQDVDLDHARAELQNQIDIIKHKMLHIQHETGLANDVSDDVCDDVCDDQNQDLESDEVRAQQVQQLEAQYRKQSRVAQSEQFLPEPKNQYKRKNK
jgi:hypothetical protein